LNRLAALVVAAALLSLPAAALADPPSPDNQVGKEILGLVPPHNGASKTSGSGGGLVYHGGPVVRGDKTIAIYWTPSGYSNGAGYDTTINQFLGDVAAASGRSDNVYAVNTQYSDGLGAIPYQSQFVRAITDTNTFPASGCTDSVAATGPA
jgi:hypothetical protein